MISRKHWSPGSDVSVQSVERRDSGGWTVSGSLTPNGICPDCGLQSRRRHAWRRSRLLDYPARGDGVTVSLQVCRWRCLASTCPRRTFSDQIGSIARPFVRRTSRVGEIVSHLGHTTGGRPAERLLHRLGLGVSDDTVLRQLKNRTQDTAEPPTVIGIDDWSWRKSQTYGTIVVDLERRAVIDVLEDRDVVTCTDWLKRHPEVEVISRDRCGLYAQAARQGAPQAKQVADRFHIVQNLAAGHRGADEPARPCDRQGAAVRSGQHRRSRKPSEVPPCAPNVTGGDIHHHPCAPKSGAYLQRDWATNSVPAFPRSRVAASRNGCSSRRRRTAGGQL
ncbi:MAG: transposase [Rhodobacteraceae bacterium]|nr:MAG: transposase [Paracoccaceae bacterium]